MVMSPLWHHSLYLPLDSRKKQLRLLTISRMQKEALLECDVQTFDLDQVPRFDAISYVWGDGSLVERINFCGLQRRVTRNLFQALKRLQKQDDSNFMWIDDLCINQQDKTEKNHQVPLMRHIYKSAERVFSWLGHSDTDTLPGFSLIERWADAILSTNPTAETWSNSQARREAIQNIERPFDLQDWTSFVAFARKSYWERIWILQEVTLARQCILLCGDYELPFEKLMWAYRAWTTGNLRSPQLVELVRPVGEGTPFYSFMKVPLEGGAFVKVKVEVSAQRELRQFPFLLKRASILLASDPKDKVYGILGLLNLASGKIPVDYQCDDIAAYSNTLLTLAKEVGRLDLLSFAGNLEEGVQETTTKEWPSWVPDFRCNNRRNMDGRFAESSLYYNMFFFNASGNSIAQCNIDSTNPKLLNVRGLCLDDVAEAVQPFQRLDNEHRFYSWLSSTIRHANTIQPRSISPLQLLFRTMIADHLWRGSESPDFLATHLGVNFFRFAAGFLLTARRVLVENFASMLDAVRGPSPHQCVGPSSGFDRTLSSWLYVDPEQAENTCKQQPRVDLNKFLNQTHLHWPDTVDTNDESYDQFYLAEFSSVFSRTESRCLFVTENGYLGAGPGGMEPGDKIFLPLGCSVPLVIRKSKNNFEVIADAFVAGVMQGELFSKSCVQSVSLTDIMLQ